jgi:hypothetical protein
LTEIVVLSLIPVMRIMFDVRTSTSGTPTCGVKRAAFASRLRPPPWTAVGTRRCVVVPSPSWP